MDLAPVAIRAQTTSRHPRTQPPPASTASSQKRKHHNLHFLTCARFIPWRLGKVCHEQPRVLQEATEEVTALLGEPARPGCCRLRLSSQHLPLPGLAVSPPRISNSFKGLDFPASFLRCWESPSLSQEVPQMGNTSKTQIRLTPGAFLQHEHGLFSDHNQEDRGKKKRTEEH